MENKKNMNIVLAVIVCLVLAGILVFISIKNKANMPSSNNIDDVAKNDQTINTDNNATIPTQTPATNTTQTGRVAKTGDTVAKVEY